MAKTSQVMALTDRMSPPQRSRPDAGGQPTSQEAFSG